jgi:hypothetical protein
MATRVVITGPNDHGTVPCIELTVSDAAALVDEGLARVDLGHHGAELADATVLSFPRALLAERDPDADGWWRKVLARKPLMYQPHEFTITLA